MKKGGKTKIHNGGCILEHSPEVAVHPAGALLHLCGHHENRTVPQQGAAQRSGRLCIQEMKLNIIIISGVDDSANLRKDNEMQCSKSMSIAVFCLRPSFIRGVHVE